MFWNNVCFRNRSKCIFGCITTFSLVLSSLPPTYSYGVEFEEGFFEAKGWNLIKDVEKLLKPIYALNENSSIDDIAKEVATFKKKLDKIYYTGLSIDQVFDLVLTRLAENGVYLKKSELKHFIKLVDKYSKHKKTVSNDNDDHSFNAKKGKDDKEEDKRDMNVKSLIGCVTIFCGCLIFILPFPQAKVFGASLIAEGTREVIMGYAEENDKKKKSNNYFLYGRLSAIQSSINEKVGGRRGMGFKNIVKSKILRETPNYIFMEGPSRIDYNAIALDTLPFLLTYSTSYYSL